MEEILSSIRRIISAEGEEEGASGAEAEAVEPEPTADPDLSQDDVDSLFDASEPEPTPEPEAEDDVLELTDIVEDEPMPEPEPAPAPEPEPAVAEPPKPEGSLVSPETALASVESLSSITDALRGEDDVDPVGGRTVEQLVAALLRPVLRDWLDQNLPGMVERLVRAEIKRLAEEAQRR